MAQGTRADVADRRRRQGDARQVQGADAQSKLVRRGSPRVRDLFQMGGYQSAAPGQGAAAGRCAGGGIAAEQNTFRLTRSVGRASDGNSSALEIVSGACRKREGEILKRELTVIAALVAALPSGPSFACGACDEDKIAATYDHAVIGAAIARHGQIVFVAIDGPVDAGRIGTRLAAAASKMPGVVSASLRT